MLASKPSGWLSLALTLMIVLLLAACGRSRLVTPVPEADAGPDASADGG